MGSVCGDYGWLCHLGGKTYTSHTYLVTGGPYEPSLCTLNIIIAINDFLTSWAYVKNYGSIICQYLLKRKGFSHALKETWWAKLSTSERSANSQRIKKSNTKKADSQIVKSQVVGVRQRDLDPDTETLLDTSLVCKRELGFQANANLYFKRTSTK